MLEKLSVPVFIAALFFFSPLLASADESRSWVLWQEVINQNAILYPNRPKPYHTFAVRPKPWLTQSSLQETTAKRIGPG
ncbi:MAG: hypothetical protein D084_Lepto4C00626G0005 [Leptospirillum sp. Group IV 'UBA BS']|nr:MAG: hypothetical protein D084_Lepto4C00626G0005 [Leptospirillum sp. Group IV 'UBA BS']